MILLHRPRDYPDGETRSHASSDGSLHELHLFAVALALDRDSLFVDHEKIPHYRVPADLFDRALLLGTDECCPTVREVAREDLAARALTRREISSTRVVNMEIEGFDVRIDRATRHGNPYRIHEHGTREEVIEKFRGDAAHDLGLIDSLKLLKGKTLGCHCKPKACHGDVYVDLIRGAPIPQESLF